MSTSLMRACVCSILFCAVCALSACSGSSEQEIPAAKPLAGGASFNGVWHSTQFEKMYVRQVGDSVRGIYTYKYGGTFEGRLDGDLLVFKWIDPGDAETAVRTRKGMGYFKISTDSNGNPILKGKWGYNESHSNGGVWNAEYVRESDSDDPRNLKEWRKDNVR